MILNAIIIDDEAPSIRAIEKTITEFCENVKILGTSQSSVKGIELINCLNPDIVFLDIEMPIMNGFEMLEQIPNPVFDVVFITAYSNYAVQAFKVNALDYILKPINIKEIIRSVNRVLERRKSKISMIEQYKQVLKDVGSMQERKITFATSDGVLCFNKSEIVRFQADGRYSKIYLTSGKNHCLVRTLKQISIENTHSCFLRIHKSHLINMDFVKKYNLTSSFSVELKDGSVLDVSRRRKKEFENYMLNA